MLTHSVEAEPPMDSLADAVAGVVSETIGEILSDLEAEAQVNTLPITKKEVSVQVTRKPRCGGRGTGPHGGLKGIRCGS